MPRFSTKIEKKIKRVSGFDVPVFVRTKSEFQRLIKNTPFAGKDTTKLHVTFLSEVPTNLPVDEINAAKAKNEEFSIVGQGNLPLLPQRIRHHEVCRIIFSREN